MGSTTGMPRGGAVKKSGKKGGKKAAEAAPVLPEVEAAVGTVPVDGVGVALEAAEAAEAVSGASVADVWRWRTHGDAWVIEAGGEDLAVLYTEAEAVRLCGLHNGPQAAPGAPGVLWVPVWVPVRRGDSVPGYRAGHVQAALSRAQRESLKGAVVAADEVGLRLGNGRRVLSGADMVRWLLEALSGAVCGGGGRVKGEE